MRTAVRGISLLLSLNAASIWAQTQSLSIDPRHPYAYLEFVRIGLRQPLTAGEGNLGIYLRFRNNSRFPMVVEAYDVDSKSPEVALRHSVVPVVPSDAIELESTKLQVPTGYDSSHISTPIEIPPGSQLLFATPSYHVRPDWYVSVKFELPPSKSQVGRSPTSFVDFVWTDLPPGERERLVR